MNKSGYMWGAVFTFFLGATGIVGYEDYQLAKEKELRRDLASQLHPYVEMVDGEPEISSKDQIDFLKRAGIPTKEVIGKEKIDFTTFHSSKLEKALKSYQSE